MQSLDKIRRRIRSIKVTAKITGAMKLVATAKMKQLTNNFKKTTTYINDFYNIMGELFLNVDEKKINKKITTTKSLWIVITSSLGLCGGYNTAICKETMAKMNKDDDLIIIGKKGYSYFKSRKIIKNIINQYDFGDQVIDHYYFLPLTESIMQMYEENKYANINLCYTTFVNSLVFNPRIIRLLPLDKKLFHPDDSNHKFTSLTKDNKEIIYEASREEIIKSISPLYITTLIYGAYSESRLCEFASRRNAMENATDNANELIEQLTLEYNVVRQQNITQEINEIVGGSSAGE